MTSRDGLLEGSWIVTQKKIFTRWMNAYLRMRFEKVDDIYTDLADGIVRSVASSEIVVGGSPCREMSTVRGAAAELPAPRTASRFSVLSIYALSHTHRNVCLTPTLVHSTLTLY